MKQIQALDYSLPSFQVALFAITPCFFLISNDACTHQSSDSRAEMYKVLVALNEDCTNANKNSLYLMEHIFHDILNAISGD
jgi:hypothetical protein